MVRRGDEVGLSLSYEICKRLFAESARLLFHPPAVPARERGDICGICKEGHARPFAQVFHEGGILLALLAAYAVLHVHGGKRDMQFFRIVRKEEKERHGIRPAREGDADALPRIRRKVDVQHIKSIPRIAQKSK